MKKLIILFTAILFINTLRAQIRTASNITFEDVSMMAYQLDLNANSDKVIDLWDQYWDKRHDVDVDREDRNRQREIYMAKDVAVAAISNKKMDIYSKISTTEDNKTTVSLGIGFGYDIYASTDNYGNEFNATKTVLEDFEQYFYQTYYAEKVSALRKKLDDAKDEVQDMNSDIDKNERRIEGWNKDIEDAKSNIADAEEESKQLRENMEEQRKTVQELEAELRSLEQVSSRWKADGE